MCCCCNMNMSNTPQTACDGSDATMRRQHTHATNCVVMSWMMNWQRTQQHHWPTPPHTTHHHHTTTYTHSPHITTPSTSHCIHTPHTQLLIWVWHILSTYESITYHNVAAYHTQRIYAWPTPRTPHHHTRPHTTHTHTLHTHAYNTYISATFHNRILRHMVASCMAPHHDTHQTRNIICHVQYITHQHMSHNTQLILHQCTTTFHTRVWPAMHIIHMANARVQRRRTTSILQVITSQSHVPSTPIHR